VDLDDVTSPTWNVGAGCCGRDLGFAFDAGRLSIDGGHAVVSGPLEFATCLHETAYTTSAIERGSLQPGETICVRTNGHRLALVTVVDASEQAVEFGTTVWDPRFPREQAHAVVAAVVRRMIRRRQAWGVRWPASQGWCSR
jgi:hypothetical protein